MRDLLRSLRSILEHERAVYGDMLPLDDASAAAETDGEDTPANATATGERDTSGGAAPDRETSGPATPDDRRPEAEPQDPEPQGAETQNAETQNAASQNSSFQDADARPSESQREESPEAGTEASPDASPSSPSSPDSSEATDAMPNRDLFGNEVNPAEDPSLPPWERIESLIPDDAPYKDAETLEEVETYLADTVLVPIDEERENPVFGVGDPQADLVIIGEAPGRDEDKEGEPFVGRAGTLLDKILDAINFAREDVYITNILKSRPPRNRDPHAEEVEAHLPILYKQIALIRPKIILCVGKVAGNTMLDRSSSLSSLRDQEHDFYGIPTMVTYHPAALLRNSQWKRPTWEDVKLLRTRYDQLTNGEA
jgi:DNA polymerase